MRQKKEFLVQKRREFEEDKEIEVYLVFGEKELINDLWESNFSRQVGEKEQL